MMTPRSLTLTEGGEAERYALTAREAEALHQVGLVEVTHTGTPGLYDVAPASKVGAVSVGDLQVIVRPKITDLNRLVFLLGYTHHQIWRDEPVALTAADDLMTALAEVFSRLAARATEQGLLQGYRTVSDTLPVLRGRVQVTEQMNRLYGLPIPLAVEYDEYTADIAENQILLAAVLRLMTVPQLTKDARRRLQRLRLAFSEVTPVDRGRPLPGWHPSRLNARYQDALRLAEVILAAESFEHCEGDLVVTGYLFDMWRIYEDFVSVSLGEALSRRGGFVRTQFPVFLDEADQVKIEPDIVWLDQSRRPIAVIDAKYKAERPSGFPDADLYQLLAYCTAMQLPIGHLIYAKGNEPVREHTVRHVGIKIRCHTLDLSLPPRELLDQVAKLAAAIAAR